MKLFVSSKISLQRRLFTRTFFIALTSTIDPMNSTPSPQYFVAAYIYIYLYRGENMKNCRTQKTCYDIIGQINHDIQFYQFSNYVELGET